MIKKTIMKKAMRERKELTNKELEKQLLDHNCCGQKMTLVETHEEKKNKVCYKYACSQCKSSIFDYGEKPRKSITLTANQYESLLNEMKELSEKQKKIYQILNQASAD
jgi:hypothetical protein